MLKTSRDSEIIYNGGKASNSGSELKAGGKANHHGSEPKEAKSTIPEEEETAAATKQTTKQK
jgi:hypothetical protein